MDNSFAVTIDSLGAGGDGIARHDGAPLFVSYALPGERVRVRITGARAEGACALAEKVETPSAERVAPLCRHFTDCGGCAMQHLKREAYEAWKRGILVTALSQARLDNVNVAPLVPGHLQSRRRAALKARATEQGIVLGFARRESDMIVDLAECPVLCEEIVALLPALRGVLARVLEKGAKASVEINRADNGADILLSSAKEPGLAAREAIAAFVQAQDIARFSWARLSPRGRAQGEGEPVVAQRAPFVMFGGVAGFLPPAGFMQATAEAEKVLYAEIEAAMAGVSSLADCYAGAGTFSLPLCAENPERRVSSFEGSAGSCRALEQSARKAGLEGRLKTVTRDLEKKPLGPAELSSFGGVVLDPPRVGARAQAGELSRSAVPVVAYVSCNPASFARDARILCEGGYTLERVVPVDQFLFSTRLELVGIFRR